MAKVMQKMIIISLALIVLFATIAIQATAAPVGTKESDVVKYAKSWGSWG